MMRKIIIAGLLAATAIGAVAPAVQAQRWERGNDGNGRQDRGGGEARGQRPDGGQQRQSWREQWSAQQQQRSDRPQPQAQAQRPQAQPQPQMQAPRPAAPRAEGNWRDRGQTQWTQQAPVQQQQNGRDQNRGNWQGDRRDTRQDWRNDRQDDRRNWQDNRRDDRQNSRQNDRQGWSNDRRDDRGAWRNDGRRIDSAQRWSDQRRWDNGWRNDRRYDWRSYRSRYGNVYRPGRYYAPRGWSYGYRSFSIGVYLNSLLYANSYWLDDPWQYRLPPAYGTLRWVRYYDDALLVDIRDGYVVDVIRDFFW
ncbi:RcnB family protein [Sphingobium aquiterrae]|uniref:RcnB family protein n=1 Tax=Sphingobium aquiterrae TaxID=2038656 RepID=UPI00301B6408